MNTATQSAPSESIVNNAPRTFTEADFPVGTAAHQGDLILVRIAGLPEGSKPRPSPQLADGDTQGSRHVVEGGRVYDVPTDQVVRAIKAATKRNVEPQYIGPVFTTKDGKASLIHPEHGHHHYEGDMCVASVFQRNLDADEQAQRTRD